VAVSLDAAAIGTVQTGSAITVSLAAGTPSGIVLLLSMVDTGTVTITSATAGSKSATLLGSITTGGNFWKVFAYQTTATPDTGTQTITFNLSAAPSHGAVAHAISVTGGDSATPVYNFATQAFSSNTHPNIAVTCTATEGAFAVAESNANGTITADGTQTKIGQLDIGGFWAAYSSYLFGTSSPTMGFTTLSMDTALAVGAFKESSGGGSPALTTQVESETQGSLALAAVSAMTGATLPYAIGSIASAVAANALTGQALAEAQGTLVTLVSKQLAGVQLGLSQGNVTVQADGSAALSGVIENTAIGALSAQISKQLSGMAQALAQGIVTAIANGDIQLSGQTLTMPTDSQFISGVVVNL
jgi:hypothetical protein